MTGKGSALLSLPAFNMTADGGEFRALMPSVSEVGIDSVTVRASAKLAWDENGLKGTTAIGLKNIDIAERTSDMSIHGLCADIQLTHIAAPRTRPGQSITIKEINAGVSLDGLSLRFALADGSDKQFFHGESYLD